MVRTALQVQGALIAVTRLQDELCYQHNLVSLPNYEYMNE
jgi:hypothetical protein